MKSVTFALPVSSSLGKTAKTYPKRTYKAIKLPKIQNNDIRRNSILVTVRFFDAPVGECLLSIRNIKTA
jgi:hypothetical protein